MLLTAARLRALIFLFTLTLSIAFPQFAHAGCSLQIITAGPCLTNGTPGTPAVGDIYSLYVNFTIQGVPAQPFRIAFTLANETSDSGYIHGQNGQTYTSLYPQFLPLDDVIPWSVSLDPDGVSGNTNLMNSSTNGLFTPIPPSSVAELYSPRVMHGSVTSIANFQPGSGTIPNFYVLFGQPTSHGAQTVIAAPGPSGGQSVVTPPYGVPLFQVSRTNVPAGTFLDTNTFTVQLNSIRVNPALLRAVTWADMSGMNSNWTQWLNPTPSVESTNSLISNFVQGALPTNYTSVLTPYDTARTLHRAVMKRLTYGPGPYSDAVGALTNGVTVCVGFASLLTACLRNVGVPARVIAGFMEGDSVWHERVEFHLPGCEWLLADPTFGNGFDPTGTYAYYFGYDPDATNFLAVDVGELHEMPYANCGSVEQAYLCWNGGTFISSSILSFLQPNGVLTMASSSNGSIEFNLTDPPTEGMVVIDSSTNLTAWLPIATNSANGNLIHYAFPATNSPSEFYRARLIP